MCQAPCELLHGPWAACVARGPAHEEVQSQLIVTRVVMEKQTQCRGGEQDSMVGRIGVLAGGGVYAGCPYAQDKGKPWNRV